MSERRTTVSITLNSKDQMLYEKVKQKINHCLFFALNSHHLITYLCRMPFSWGITPLIAACKQKTEKTFKETEKCSGGGGECKGVENIIKKNKYTLKF